MGSPSRRSQRGLDWFVFFVADIQTGFGPFLAVYLTTQKWNQADIGLVLALGSMAGLLSQLPGGWLVDLVPSKRRAAFAAVIGIGASALLIAATPSFLGIVAAKLLHVTSSAVLGPAIAALTLGLVGHFAMGPRLGRNARFGAIGNGLAAGAMGACGYLISPQAVFYATAALTVPTLIALSRIREDEVDPLAADGGLDTAAERNTAGNIWRLISQRSMIVLTLCVFLFQASNAAMLPLVGSEMTLRSGQWASALIALCIIVPQLIVAVIAPSVGRLAVVLGRRPVLLAGFAALPLRALLLMWNTEPAAIIFVQMLDGICAAVLGVLLPLSLADVSRNTGRFNLAQGIVASATGIGAAASTAVAGYLASKCGTPIAFLGLALTGVCGFAALLALMPETAPPQASTP